MTSSQDTPGKLDAARQGIRAALRALEQIPGEDVPRVTSDGIQYQLRTLDARLELLRDALVSAGKQARSDQE